MHFSSDYYLDYSLFNEDIGLCDNLYQEQVMAEAYLRTDAQSDCPMYTGHTGPFRHYLCIAVSESNLERLVLRAFGFNQEVDCDIAVAHNAVSIVRREKQ
ncbi:MAG: hypothetical protein C4K47_03365 [Candidatus Thorarchaeota archaeon]|nr:MAG: hypothetical protein C4K47_03365 [Candidatus Thorarchaeota archaeon]